MTIPIKKVFIKYILKLDGIVKFYLLDGYATKSYSQEGEDMILKRIFEKKKQGFYVDVGAHHPKRFSNTYLFYKRGWSGINIEAMPDCMRYFKKIRARDINLNIPVSSSEDVLTYYIFNEPALNGFDRCLAKERDSSDTSYQIINEIKLKTRSLVSILDEFVPKNTKIDFISIDVEGFDLDVLKSNNWNKYRPKIILVEVLGSSLKDIETSETTKFLGAQGYKAFAKTVNTVIYRIE